MPSQSGRYVKARRSEEQATGNGDNSRIGATTLSLALGDVKSSPEEEEEAAVPCSSPADPKLSAAEEPEAGDALPVKEESLPGPEEYAVIEAVAGSPGCDDTMTSLNDDDRDRITDDDDDDHSSSSEAYDDGDLLASAMDDDVTAQLAAAGWQFKHANGDFPFFAFSISHAPEPDSSLSSSAGRIFLSSPSYSAPVTHVLLYGTL